MGFYAPAQIVRDALAHSVPVLPVDVQTSDVDCTLTTPPTHASFDCPTLAIADVKPRWTFGRGGPAVRLGLRMVRGLTSSHAHKLVAARQRLGRPSPFASIDHFCRSVDMPAHARRLLAAADAFASMGITRRAAIWELLRQRDDPMPLFRDAPDVPQPAVTLPPMPLQRQVAADYYSVGLSLKRHPLSLIRPVLSEMKILTAADLANTQNGKWVRVAGIVLVRQRPGTASGIVFASLEDETGVVNLIIRPAIYDRFRATARHSRLLRADGPLQREGLVQHVIAAQLHDLSQLLDTCPTTSRDFH
jgi:error-prone DNA polymerase